MHQVILLTSNLLIYLLFCVGSVLVGIGLMRLSGFHLALRPTLVIAPMITMVFWTIGLGIGVALRTPISILALILWPLTGAFIVSNFIPMRIARDWGITHWGARLGQTWQRSRRRAITQLIGHIWTLVVCMILPVAILLPLFSGGLAESPGTPNPDSWSYVAEGQYLWEHARGDSENLSPLHLHGLRISQLRYISGSLLAFFSPLFSAGETYATRGILVSWSIFVFAGACAFFGIKYLMSSWLLLIYLLITVTSGWISNAVLSSNYDNLISLAYFPTFAGLIPLIDLRLRRWQLLLGVLGAGMLYAYPELAPFTFAGAFLILSYRIWQERYTWRTWAIFIGGALIIGILLSLPFLRDMINFLLLQTNSAMIAAGTGTRPGEGIFKGLLSLSYYPSAFWGLGGEQTDVYLSTRWIEAGNLAGIPLTILGVIGLFRLLVDRHVGLVAALLLLLLTTFVFVFRNTYAYGAYKIILVSWWGLCFSVVYGLKHILKYLRMNSVLSYTGRILVILVVIGVGVLGQSPNIVMSRVWHFYSPYATTSMANLRQLQEVSKIIGDQPLEVIVDDWYASMWATYFLRNTRIAYLEPRYYLLYVPIKQTMPDARPSYILTDDRFDEPVEAHWRLVWANNPYRLWQTVGDWAIVTEIKNGTGVQHLNNTTFFWMGQTPATLKVLATKRGLVQIDATYFPGPSLPGQTRRKVLVTSAPGVSRQVDIDSGEQEINLPVEAGISNITLQALDQPTIAKLPNGDTRSLILGVQGLTVSLSESLIAVEHIENPNGIEQLDGKQFFWMGKDQTAITVQSAEAGKLLLGAYFLLGPSLPELPIRKILIATDHGYQQTHTMTTGEQTIELPVSAGKTVITLTTLDAPTVSHLSNGDTRPLVLGVQGLRVWLDKPNQSAKK